MTHLLKFKVRDYRFNCFITVPYKFRNFIL